MCYPYINLNIDFFLSDQGFVQVIILMTGLGILMEKASYVKVFPYGRLMFNPLVFLWFFSNFEFFV